MSIFGKKVCTSWSDNPLPSLVTYLSIHANINKCGSSYLIFGVSCYGGRSIQRRGLFSILLLWRIIDVRYCIAIVFMLVNVSCSGVSFLWYSFVSMFNDGMCVDPLAPAMITISERTLQPLLQISSRRGMYLSIFCWIFSWKNRSFVYVNLMNCICKLGSGALGG